MLACAYYSRTVLLYIWRARAISIPKMRKDARVHIVVDAPARPDARERGWECAQALCRTQKIATDSRPRRQASSEPPAKEEEDHLAWCAREEGPPTTAAGRVPLTPSPRISGFSTRRRVTIFWRERLVCARLCAYSRSDSRGGARCVSMNAYRNANGHSSTTSPRCPTSRNGDGRLLFAGRKQRETTAAERRRCDVSREARGIAQIYASRPARSLSSGICIAAARGARANRPAYPMEKTLRGRKVALGRRQRR